MVERDQFFCLASEPHLLLGPFFSFDGPREKMQENQSGT